MRRTLLALVLGAALVAAAAGTASGAVLSSSYAWSTGFTGSSDSSGFNVPSDGGTHGNCTRKLSGGAAWYTWVSSASDGGATRCYPAQLWAPDYIRGVVARGRFWLDVNPAEIGNSEWLSLMTLSMHPSSLITINVKVNSTGPTAGKPRLILWHVPYEGQGGETRNAYVAFPLRTWVEVTLSVTAGGAVEVRQDGKLILSGQKKDSPGEVQAVHFGGYASGPVHGWVIGNDDLRVQSNGVALPPSSGTTAPRPPSTTAPRTTTPAPAPPAGGSAPSTPAAGTGTAPVGGPGPGLTPIGSTPALTGTAAADNLTGGPSNERLAGRAGPDILFGRGGSDLLMGGAGADRLMAGPGIDHLYGGPDRDVIFGGPGKDLLVGGPGRDGIVGGPGDDRVLAADGAYDLVRCGPGYDRVLGDPGDRVLADCELVQNPR